ncbi:MAG: hypothetical protein KDA79_25105, partial [Planctomycetaceae bacterium]|nr:hypothetical protein [Planctomycetaceae bacterium]
PHGSGTGARLLAGLSVLLLAGCFMDALEEQTKSKPGEGIMRKTTQEVGKYDPEAGLVVSDAKVRATNPITGPLEAYGPMVEQIVQLKIEPAITMFEIQHEHYPSYDEFMKEIIHGQNVQLPVLPAESRYQYDEENHKLRVVLRPEDGWPKDEAKPPAAADEAPGAAPGVAAPPADAAPAGGATAAPTGTPGAGGALDALEKARGRIGQ